MALPILLNGTRSTTTVLSMPWRGVWHAECELDAEAVDVLPTSGPAILTIGDTVCKCTIDPRATGKFANRFHARVIGGSAGWDKPVKPQHFSDPSGNLLSNIVYAATAAEVKEAPPVDASPTVLGQHYVRMAGEASRIFGDRDWYVDLLTGIAQIRAWPTIPASSDWSIIDYDIEQKRILVSGDDVIYPGSSFTDTRLGAGTFIARDVVQTFSADGIRAEVWLCDKPVSRLQEAMAIMVRTFGRTAFSRFYSYRFAIPEPGGKLALQAITPGAPDLNPIDQWTGLAGITASLAGQVTLALGTEIIVGFTADDPPQPFLAAFSNLAKPLTITLDATTSVVVGVPKGPAALAPGLVTITNAISAQIAGIAAAFATLGAKGAVPIQGTDCAAVASTLNGVLSPQNAAIATALPTVTSTKLLIE